MHSERRSIASDAPNHHYIIIFLNLHHHYKIKSIDLLKTLYIKYLCILLTRTYIMPRLAADAISPLSGLTLPRTHPTYTCFWLYLLNYILLNCYRLRVSYDK